jgi:hypothetical protein
MASSRTKEQPMGDEKPMGYVIQIDEARIRDHLGETVRGTVEETLNAMLDADRWTLRNIVGTAWSTKCYMNMRPLYQPQPMQTEAVA